jgi:NTP pyrophosphatase (non-canonical NTP hydrolase)
MKTAPVELGPLEGDLTFAQALSKKPERFLDWLDVYQEAASRTDQNVRSGMEGLAFPLLGLFGEVGTLLSALKKKQRDKVSYIGYAEAVVEEFGDVLWYFSNIASRASLSMSDLARHVFQNRATSNEFDRARGGSLNSSEFEAAVIALAGTAGLLLGEFDARKVGNKPDILYPNLVDVFSALIRAAAVADIDLEQAAQDNIHKINSRWPTNPEFAPLFDNEFHETEQLPRKIEMHIVETHVAGKTCVIQLCNGVELGSRLTDNKIVEDDYRFHDVFHLAYAAILGWSPCLRALLKVKRKSRPEIDEAQDGARAILIEEGVSTLIFHHALQLHCFASIQSLDYSLLKTVQNFVHGFEVDQCPLWQWEKAILDGFAVFRRLRTERRGVVVADLVNHSIVFKTASK